MRAVPNTAVFLQFVDFVLSHYVAQVLSERFCKGSNFPYYYWCIIIIIIIIIIIHFFL